MEPSSTPDRLERYAPTLLRYGLALVFLYFGVSQLLSPAMWTIWLPAWSGAIPVAPTTLILVNGAVEVVVAILLLLGLWTRIVSAIAALHMLAITLDIGYTEIGVRDFAITIALVALALLRPDGWTLDRRRAKRTA